MVNDTDPSYICSQRQFGSLKTMFHGPFYLFYFQAMSDNDFKKSLFETMFIND